MQPTIFISRDLQPGSVFYKKLTASGFEVTGLSLIEFSALPFDLAPKMDWFFFYSKNGVRFFFEKMEAEKIADVKIAAIGPATAGEVRRFGRSADFVGDGAPNSTAALFLKLASGQRVVFPQAANSRRSVQQFLGGEIKVVDLVVYQNLPKKNVALPACDVLVFTSPMNAQAYFSQKKWQAGQRVIAIGPTTAGALRELGILKIEVAEEPSEAGLAKAAFRKPGV